MRLTTRWMMAVALVGATAAIMAAGLFWLVLTRPVALAQALGHGLF